MNIKEFMNKDMYHTKHAKIVKWLELFSLTWTHWHMVGPILEGPVPHLIGPVPKYTIIWNRSNINIRTKFKLLRLQNQWQSVLSLLSKDDTSDTHHHFGFNMKRKPEMNYCYLLMLVWLLIDLRAWTHIFYAQVRLYGGVWILHK